MPKKRSTVAAKDHEAKPYRKQRKDELVNKLVAVHACNSQAILPILQGITAAHRSLNPEVLGATADATGVHDSQVSGIASFYSRLSPLADSANPILVCDGPTCMLNKAHDARSNIEAEVRGQTDWFVGRTSCLGLCDRAPAALVNDEPCGPINSERIHSLLAGERGANPCYKKTLAGEQRVAMARIGKLDPESIDSALRIGAYQALKRACFRAASDVIQEISHSGLRGCGGAGFPTGKKWSMVAKSDSRKKFVICNADESEPGAFKDRVLMENDPHLVLEGMAIAAYGVGATEGVIYVRGEYERCAQLLERAIQEAEQQGCLGEKIDGTPFSFHVRVHRGAGAYICGEETALLESLEGRRGEPRLRPPYPTLRGYLGRPTVVNNVETLCMVPAIVEQGAQWYRSIGPAESPGTKVFTLSGHARRAAAFESPFGITVRSILHRIGGGMPAGTHFKMALTGGAAGTLIPESLLDVPLNFDSANSGVALGSGVVVICNQSVSAVDLLECLLNFFRHESCGKCTPCREGTRVTHELVKQIARGKGCVGDLAKLTNLADALHNTSFCGLGQSVALPIRSALKHFAEDFYRCGAT